MSTWVWYPLSIGFEIKALEIPIYKLIIQLISFFKKIKNQWLTFVTELKEKKL